MSSLASGTPSLDASKHSESGLPAAPVALPVCSTAIVYCEGQFGEQDGKTANGLVRHSEKYEILSVIDSLRAGADAGKLFDGTAQGTRVLASLPDRIARGLHITNGLREFPNGDAEFVAAAVIAGVTIPDVRRPKDKRDLH